MKKVLVKLAADKVARSGLNAVDYILQHGQYEHYHI